MELTPILVTAVVFLGIYKILELFVRRQERMKLIDKITELPADRIADLNFLRNNDRPLFTFGQDGSRFTSLRWGAMVLGLGLGLIVAPCVPDWFFIEKWHDRVTMQSGCVLLFCGLALLISFVLEYKMRRNKE